MNRASNGRFPGDPQTAYDHWTELVDWFSAADLDSAEVVDAQCFDVPVPRPRQFLAIGLNYREHALESKMAVPEHPVVFGKFASSLTSDGSTVVLPSDGVDWEVELAVVIGLTAHKVSESQALSHVAGYTVGQDLSWRAVQTRGPAPQFSIGKSYPGFSPLGPAVVSLDEFADPNDLAIGCSLNGEVLQSGRTSDLIFPVPEVISRLSRSLTLYPGDVILTGTPAGVGIGREPQRFLTPGSLVSHVETVGDLHVNLVSRSEGDL